MMLDYGYTESFTLTATVEPSDATDQRVVWTSESPSVASVDANGTVTAQQVEGITHIWATTVDGGYQASCVVVTARGVLCAATGVSLDQPELSLTVGGTAALTATVAPDDATVKLVDWASSDGSVATVDDNGVVTGVAPGTATITATTADGGFTDKCEVTVTAAVPVSAVLLEQAHGMTVGDTYTLVAGVYPPEATDKGLDWTSSDTSVATVDGDGTVTAVSAGEATITVATTDGSDITTGCLVTVTAPMVAVTGVTLSQAFIDLPIGTSGTLAASVEPADATNQNLTWSSSDPAVATVDESGVVTAQPTPGMAWITVTTEDGGFVARCAVLSDDGHILFVPVTGVSLDQHTFALILGHGFTLNATVEPSSATDPVVIWTSSEDTVATVDADGNVEAVSTGTVVITATTVDGGFTDSCTVQVSAPTPPSTYFLVHNEAELTDALAAAAASGLPTTVELANDIDIDQTTAVADGANVTLVGAYQLAMTGDGATLEVADGASLLIDGVTVTHSAGASGNGVVVAAGGSLDLAGGSITSNNADQGAGVYNQGSFTMTGGAISNNTATVGGGGVYNDGTMCMSGGGVVNNSAGADGFGIAVSGPSAKLVMGGSAKVLSNYSVSYVSNDVYLPAGAYITLGDGTNGAAVPSGMLVFVVKTADNGVAVSAGAIAGDTAMLYSSDTSKYVVYDNGQLVLAPCSSGGLVFDAAAGMLYVDMNGNRMPDAGIDTVCPGEGTTWVADGSTLTLTGFDYQAPAQTLLSIPNGPATIMLEGTNRLFSTYLDPTSLYVYGGSAAGISAGSLTIDGSGTLDVTSGWANGLDLASVGITAGALTIDGGTVTAQGSNHADDSWGVMSGMVTVNGGTLNAVAGTATTDAHGIAGKITLNGGTLNAIGGSDPNVSGYGLNAAVVTINSGIFTASGSRGASVDQSSGPIILPDTYTWWSSTTDLDPGGPGTAYDPGGTGTPYIFSTLDKFIRVEATAPLASVPVTALLFSAQTLDLTVGGSSALTVEVDPPDATDPAVSWSSSDPTVATVDADGVVTAIAPGTATVTAVSTDGSDITAECVVTVTNPPVAPSAPQDLETATSGDRQVTLTWTVPATDGGSPITNYEVSSDNGATWVALDPADPGATSYVFNGLFASNQGGTQYTFALRALNAIGAGDAATAVGKSATLPYGSEPIWVVGDGQITASASTFAGGDGGSPVTNCSFTATPTSGGTPVTVAGPGSSVVITGLQNGVEYLVTGTISNAIGTADVPSFTATPVAAAIPATGVQLDQATLALTIGVGGSATLGATVQPANATDQDITWTSSDEGVATVDTGGNVTAVAVGTATITVTTVDGGYTDTCAVTVTAPTVQDHGLVLNLVEGVLYIDTDDNGLAGPGIDTVCPGEGSSWDFDGSTPNGPTLTLTDFNWTTSAPRALVLTTTQSGDAPLTIDLVGTNSLISVFAGFDPSPTCGIWAPNFALTLLGGGSLKATGGSGNNYVSFGLYAVFGLTVDGPTVTATGGASLQSLSNGYLGGPVAVNGGTLSAIGGPARYGGAGLSASDVTLNAGTLNAVGGDATDNTMSGGTSRGIDGNTTVNGGTLNATSGSAYSYSAGIYGNVTVDGGSARIISGPSDLMSCAIYIVSNPLNVTIGAGSLVLEGQTHAVFNDLGDVSFDPLGSYTWWASTSAADPGGTGTLSSVGPYALSDADKYVKIVSDIPTSIDVRAVSLDQTTLSLPVDGSGALSAMIVPATAPNQAVAWTSDNPAVATVDTNGQVTAVAAGTATVTVTTDDGGFSASCTVTVTDVTVLVTAVLLEQAHDMTVGDTYTLVAGVYPPEATDKGLDWTSSDTGVATVDAYGTVTAVSAGQAMVTAATTDGSGITAGCLVTVTAPTVAATGVTLDKDALALAVGGTYTLTATVEPTDATDQGVTWASGDDSVATVDDSGLITAIAAGQATVTVTTEDGGFTAMCGVTVKAAPVHVTGVALDQHTLALTAGDTYSLTATVMPTDATDQGVAWASSDGDVATVDDSGLVTAIAAGTATVTVTTADGGFTATCGVTVKAAPVHVTGVALDQHTLALTAGDTYSLTATVMPTDATDQGVAWASSDGDVATVDDSGLVTAIAAGTATVTVTTADGGFTATCGVTVKAAPVHVTGVALDEHTLALTAGGTYALKATVMPADADDMSVTWTTSDDTVARVGSDGLVTAVAEGTAAITATTNDGHFSASCAVTVTAAPVPVTAVLLEQAHDMTAGDTYTLVAGVYPPEATNKGLDWSSSDTSVATVDAYGTVMAVSAGQATVTAATTDGSGITAGCLVTVTNPLAAPSAPQGLVAATSGDRQVTLTWAAPADDGGSAITNYEASSDGGATWTALDPADPDANSYVFNNLFANNQGGTEYTFALRALNAVGAGDVATVVGRSATLPYGSEPTWVPGDGQITVFVSTFASGDGGSPVTGCGFTATPVSGGTPVTAAGPGSSVVITGLQNGVEYLVTGTVSNAIGTADVPGFTATPYTTPGAPEGLGAAPSDGAVALFWGAPADDGGSPVTGYQASSDAGATWADVGTGTGYTFDGLTNGQAYTFMVRAMNAAGGGAPSDAVGAAPMAAAAPVPVAGVLISDQAISLKEGGQHMLVATVFPPDATDKSVAWASSDGSVATVGADGDVTGVAPGTATVTVTTNDGGIWTTCEVTVTAAPVPATGVSLDQATLGLATGGTAALTAVVSPANATDTSVTWTSDDTSVATVDAFGLVTGVAPGTATVTATATDGGYTAACEVTVTAAAIHVTDVTLDQHALGLTAGGTATLTAMVSPANATDKAVNWTSSDPSVATVDGSGLVTAVAPGTATVTVTALDGGFSDTCDVTVTAMLPAPVHADGVTLGQQTLGLAAGTSAALTAVVSPADATDKSVAWASSDTSVATVGADGLVTGVAPGTATVTAITADGGFTAACAVTVTAMPPAPVRVTGVTLDKAALVLDQGGSAMLTATVAPADATDKAVTWTTNNPALVTVSVAGAVTATPGLTGQAAITVTTHDGGFTATCTVTVEAAQPATVPVSGVSTSVHAFTLEAGASATVSATVLPADATDPAVIWSTSDAGVATVSASAMGTYTASALSAAVVTGVAPGTATITVATREGGFVDAVIVTVTASAVQPAIATTGVSLDKAALALAPGQTAALAATVEPANADDQAVTWTSSDTSVATVDAKGNVTAVGAGTATVTATTVDRGWVATCTVTVSGTGIVRAASVTLDKAALALEAGQSAQLSATVSPADAQYKDVAWDSDNPSVATVDADGLVTAHAVGTATITATTADGGHAAECVVTVTAPAAADNGNGSSSSGSGSSGNVAGATKGTVPGTADHSLGYWALLLDLLAVGAIGLFAWGIRRFGRKRGGQGRMK